MDVNECWPPKTETWWLRLRQTSDVFGSLRTSSGIFANDLVVFKNPSSPRIKISRLYLRKSWQVYNWSITAIACVQTSPRLLFPLLHAEKWRLRNTVANRVPASRWVPKILGTCCDRLTYSAHCLKSGLIMYAVIYVIGVFQPKQIKTCILVRRPFEILCEATENLTSARKLFLYNLLCMTHHTIFVKSVWENYKSGVDFAPGRHFGESQPRN